MANQLSDLTDNGTKGINKIKANMDMITKNEKCMESTVEL